jgi:hypothetical protein
LEVVAGGGEARAERPLSQAKCTAGLNHHACSRTVMMCGSSSIEPAHNWPSPLDETSTFPYTCGMAATKMLRVSDRTHDGFRREAQRRGATIDEVAAAALRALRQKEMGEQLASPLEADESEWLDAPLR